MRSMWKGAISFGLVMIPIKLYAATEQKDIAFRQVHREDGGRIRFRRVCSIDGEEVAYEDVAKGYELPNGEMVVLTEDDLAELPLPTTRNIEVLHFLPAEQLDPILLNRSYFVEPESAGSRAYVLLRDSLDRSGKVALAQVALRQRESLATLRTRDGLLVLETLLWPDEVRTPDFAFLDEDIEVRSQELKMAASLIESMTVDFDPDEYHDGYREALQELVDAKIEGRDVIQPEDEAGEAAEPTSLADALKASLAAAQEPRQAAGEVRAEAKSPRRAVGGGTRTRGTSGRTGAGRGSAKDGAAKDSAAKDGAAKDGAAKDGVAKNGADKNGADKNGADKNGGTRASGTRASGTRAAGTRAAGTRASGTKDGGTKTGTSKPATSKGTRRRAS